MAISYLTYGTGVYTANTVPITLVNTTNFVNGQTILVAFVFVFGTSALTLTKPGASWTQVGSNVNVGAYCSAGCYWKVWATGDGTGPFTWATTNVTRGHGGIQAFNGVNYTSPIDAYNSGSGASGTTLTVTSINAAGTDEAILGFGGNYRASSTVRTFTAQSCATAGALSEKYDGTGATYANSMGSNKIWTGSGATGNFTSTISGTNSGWIGFLVTLNAIRIGTIAANLSPITGAETGTVKVSGTEAGTLSQLTSSIAAGAKVSGSLAGNLAALISALAGSVYWAVRYGTIAATLSQLTGAQTGSVAVKGDQAANLLALLANISGEIKVDGAASAVLAALIAELSGGALITGSYAANTTPLIAILEGLVTDVGEERLNTFINIPGKEIIIISARKRYPHIIIP